MPDHEPQHDPYFKLRPPPETPNDELCKCAGHKPIKLMVALGYNPLHCIVCNAEVSPGAIPLSIELVEEIARWRNVYAAIDHLWLDSGEYEAWAKTQLEDIHSPVNARGLALCRSLNTLRRCYYWYFQDETADDFVPKTHCAYCGKQFVSYSAGIFPQFICEKCSIITVAR